MPAKTTERCAEPGIADAMGRGGDSYDDAMAETIHSLHEAEVIHRRPSWKTGNSVGLTTRDWVAWLNHHRLLEPIDGIAPADAEASAIGGPPSRRPRHDSHQQASKIAAVVQRSKQDRFAQCVAR